MRLRKVELSESHKAYNTRMMEQYGPRPDLLHALEPDDIRDLYHSRFIKEEHVRMKIKMMRLKDALRDLVLS